LPGWQIYSERFNPDHIYLELEGVAAEITMTGNMERTVLLRLPVATAKQPRLDESLPGAPVDDLLRFHVAATGLETHDLDGVPGTHGNR
jgi:hypothetical protein